MTWPRVKLILFVSGVIHNDLSHKLGLPYSKTEYSHMIALATVNSDVIVKDQQKEQSSERQKVSLTSCLPITLFLLEIYIRKTSCRGGTM